MAVEERFWVGITLEDGGWGEVWNCLGWVGHQGGDGPVWSESLDICYMGVGIISTIYLVWGEWWI